MKAHLDHTGQVLNEMNSGYYDYPPASTQFAQKHAAYGNAEAPLKPRFPERRPGLRAMLVCLFAPILVFAVVASALSFSVRFWAPWLSWLVVAAALVVVALSGVLAAQRTRSSFAGDAARGPAWYIFLFLTLLLAWILGVFFGGANYTNNTYVREQVENLMTYSHVDPDTWKGMQLMDAGSVTFTEGTSLDLVHAIGFKNVDRYCVAPISKSTNPASRNYDFWAVGLNCCSGSAGDFKCGEWNNPAARSGLRLMREDQRAFYRLAVQQAEANFDIKADHPVFFFWMSDPSAELSTYPHEALKAFLTALLAFGALQVFLVVIAAIATSKLGI